MNHVDRATPLGEYTHKRTGNNYIVLENFRIKVKGNWEDSVLYVSKDGEKYGRTTEDFLQSFEKAEGFEMRNDSLHKAVKEDFVLKSSNLPKNQGGY